MVADEPAFMPCTVSVPPRRATVQVQLERYCGPGGVVQDFGKARGSREQYAEIDQNLRPTGEAHPSCRQRKNMGNDEQARKLERGLEFELQCWRS